jgi:hypothetical protein
MTDPVVKEFLKGGTDLLHQVLNENWLPPKTFSNVTLRYFDLEAVDEFDRNTKVTVEGIPSKGYWGDVVQYYNRLDIGTMYPTLEWQTPLPINRENVHPYLVASTGLNLTIEDLAEFDELPLDDGAEITINIEMAATSLQWIGQVLVTIRQGPSWLDLMFRKKELDVLRHPSEKYDKPYGRMVTWGYDFAFHYDDLKPGKTGYMTSYNNLVKTTNQLGFPPFANGRVQDIPTAQLVDANPAFERCFVMFLPGGEYTGPLYFHYNPF